MMNDSFRPVTRLCRKCDPNLPRQGDTTDNFVRYTLGDATLLVKTDVAVI